VVRAVSDLCWEAVLVGGLRGGRGRESTILLGDGDGGERVEQSSRLAPLLTRIIYKDILRLREA
jgi:hypothetical protein